MTKSMYKVNVEIDVYVVAEDLAEAAKVAKKYAGQEVADFAKAHASAVESVYEIPEDWRDIIPYSEGATERRTCSAIMLAAKDKPKEKEQPKETVEVIQKEVKQEEAPKKQHHEELPVELPKEDPDLPQLRFKI